MLSGGTFKKQEEKAVEAAASFVADQTRPWGDP